MSFPVCTIKVYNTDDELVHTITDAWDVQTVKHLSGAAGTFNFTVPAMKGTGTYVYNDIGNNYKVEIYMGYDSIAAADLQLTGRIQKFSSPLKTPQLGYVRVFEGKDQAEVFDRRLKVNKRYIGEAAANIIGELIAELTDETGISADSENDLTPVTIGFRTETYLNALKKVSDYWYDADTQVKMDFYVTDDTNQFVWKSRPLRTVGVETLTVGGNIKEYTLTYDILPVKNYITVYGAAQAPVPNDKDFWTEDPDDLDDNWTLAEGDSLALDHVTLTPKEGSEAILCIDSDIMAPFVQEFVFRRTLPKLNTRNINKLNFWYYPGSTTGAGYASLTCRLLAPSAGSYFELHTELSKLQQWYWASIAVGESAEYDADENDTGVWDKTGTPNWWDLEAIEFEGASAGQSGALLFGLDKLYFSPERWTYTAEDATSQTAYGIRAAEYTDDNLLSNSECEARAKTLLYQLKDRALRLDVSLEGNTNVLIGDRIPITLPADNITAENFDVLTVTHHFTGAPLGFGTTANMIYTSDIRKLPPLAGRPLDSVIGLLDSLKQVTSELYRRVVR